MEKLVYYYKSFQIVIRNINGTWKSAGWFPHYKEKTYELGQTSDEALNNVKIKIDNIVAGNINEFQRAIKAKHAEYLKGGNKENLGTGSIQRKHRVNNCHRYRCGRPVDNTYDIECASCGWIVCVRCGSCGCGLGYAGRAST